MSASPRSPLGAPVGHREARGATVVTRPLDGLPVDLIAALPNAIGNSSFVSERDGLVGWGTFARFTATGRDAAARIASWWSDLVDELAVDDQVGIPGSGPVAFISLGFADSDSAVAVVPQFLLGSRDGRQFLTTVGDVSGSPLRAASPVGTPGRVTYDDGSGTVPGYVAAVREATRRIRAGALRKVVLAHDMVARTERPVDERFLLSRLAAAYPTCWTFAVDGLVGASPEMLVRRFGRRVSSRVLAGTAWPEHAGEHTAGTVATHLLASSKDLEEHAYAVDSVAEVLATISADVRVPRGPRALPLANLTHLVTDITAKLPAHSGHRADSPSSALGLAAKLHPTAAVGGTPRDRALELIAELETAPRGRYAAPVGWLDGSGDGEFAIALRCAQISPDADGGSVVRLVAGCGVVAGSDPEVEAREAQIKMIPIRDALEN